jgi:hypothetical protein
MILCIRQLQDPDPHTGKGRPPLTAADRGRHGLYDSNAFQRLKLILWQHSCDRGYSQLGHCQCQWVGSEVSRDVGRWCHYWSRDNYSGNKDSVRRRRNVTLRTMGNLKKGSSDTDMNTSCLIQHNHNAGFDLASLTRVFVPRFPRT